MDNSSIGWTDSTFNGWIGCTKKSPGCKHCYAEQLMDKQYHKVQWGPQGTRKKTSDFYWEQVRHWNANRYCVCMICGARQVYNPNKGCVNCATPLKGNSETVRRRVFAHSLSDVFEPKAEVAGWRLEEMQLWVDTPNLDWLVLTKYPEDMLTHVEDGYTFPDNVALGVSVENLDYGEERIPLLHKSGAKVKFLSVEPMLGPLDFRKLPMEGIDWVICGAESGNQRRPFRVEWAVDLYAQCQKMGIRFFMKQGSAAKPGQQGDVPDWLWGKKEFPLIGSGYVQP